QAVVARRATQAGPTQAADTVDADPLAAAPLARRGELQYHGLATGQEREPAGDEPVGVGHQKEAVSQAVRSKKSRVAAVATSSSNSAQVYRITETNRRADQTQT